MEASCSKGGSILAKGSNLAQAKPWLFALGGLGVVIVIFSVVVNSINSGVSVLGYVVGFVCILLAAMAAYGTRNSRKPNETPVDPPKKRKKK